MYEFCKRKLELSIHSDGMFSRLMPRETDGEEQWRPGALVDGTILFVHSYKWWLAALPQKDRAGAILGGPLEVFRVSK